MSKSGWTTVLVEGPMTPNLRRQPSTSVIAELPLKPPRSNHCSKSWLKTGNGSTVWMGSCFAVKLIGRTVPPLTESGELNEAAQPHARSIVTARQRYGLRSVLYAAEDRVPHQ